MSENEKIILDKWFWIAALAVLDCPMGVEEKREMLMYNILEDASYETLKPVPLTELQPFDLAVATCWVKIVNSYHEVTPYEN